MHKPSKRQFQTKEHQPHERDHIIEEDPDPVIAALGDCRLVYTKLEDCLVDNGRDWIRCQAGVII